MTLDEYIAELRRREASLVAVARAVVEGDWRSAGVAYARADGLDEAATLAESVTAPTWRDVTPEHPAVGEPVIIMLRGMFAIVERKADGEWWTDWSAGHQRIHSSGQVATRYLPIPADAVPLG